MLCSTFFSCYSYMTALLINESAAAVHGAAGCTPDNYAVGGDRMETGWRHDGGTTEAQNETRKTRHEKRGTKNEAQC